MKFSLLIANYNNGRFFIDCYESIINQTYNNWEAIILDDCSTDNSIEIIKNIIGDDKRFIIFINDNNSGVGYTKDKLINLAEGDICGFIDPDDALLPNAITDSIEVLQKNKKIIATYSRLTLCDENLNIKEDFNKIKQVYNYKYFFDYPVQLAHFFTFKRSIYLKTEGISPLLKSSVDQDLYLKLLEHGNAKFIDKRMYKYRLHDSGISQSQSKSRTKDNFAKVIFSAMQRRGLKTINGKKIPENFTSTQEIFKLLDYQNAIYYRLINKIRILFQNI